MGIVKLNENYIKLIKHLDNIGLYNHTGISNFLDGKVSRRHISAIVNNKRWVQIPTPTVTEGHYLLYKYKLEGKL